MREGLLSYLRFLKLLECGFGVPVCSVCFGLLSCFAAWFSCRLRVFALNRVFLRAFACFCVLSRVSALIPVVLP
jgi:hypothetical protein